MQPTSELKREMNPETLKKIMGWIADHRLDAYSAETVSHDLDMSIDSTLDSAHAVIKTVLMNALNSGGGIRGTDTSETSDDLFDVILTFLENLNEYKTAFQRIFSPSKLSIQYINLTPIIGDVSGIVFKPYIETFLDNLTYNVIMATILHAWINDETADLSRVYDRVNHISKSIITYH